MQAKEITRCRHIDKRDQGTALINLASPLSVSQTCVQVLSRNKQEGGREVCSKSLLPVHYLPC